MATAVVAAPARRRAARPRTARAMCYPPGMRILPFVAGALLLTLPAKADKFWLTDPETQKQSAAEGSSPDYVEGVLIAESDEGYHVRIVGGEVLLPKGRVFKVEKDSLSIDAIVKAERDGKAKRDAAEQERRLAQEIVRKQREVQTAEAAARRSEAAATNAPATRQPAPEYDPTLHVVPANQGDLMREVQMAWALTKDRAYLKLLRQMRRMR